MSRDRILQLIYVISALMHERGHANLAGNELRGKVYDAKIDQRLMELEEMFREQDRLHS